MAITSMDNLLGCGRNLDEVWEHADEPPNEHEQRCSDCQLARRNVKGLSEATQQLQQSDLEDPTLRLSAHLMDKVALVARAEIRRGSRIPLLRTDGTGEADLAISEQAVTSVVWHASDQLPDIEARRCVVHNVDASGPGKEPVTIDITLHISIAAGGVIPEQVAGLRHRLATSVESCTGIRVGAADVIVEDLHDA